MARGNPKRRFGGKMYHRLTQGWPDKTSALRSAKNMRNIGYKARVVFEGRFYRVYLRE